MIANYVKQSVDEYIITTKYNDLDRKYHVTEFKLLNSILLSDIEVQQNYKLIDPSLNCEAYSKESKLKCVKCQDGYLLTNFYELFVTSQGKQTTSGTNAPTDCSKKIPNCKYQFMKMCV